MADEPFVRENNPKWGEEVYAYGWKPAESGLSGKTLKGPCPRCTHTDGIDEYVPTSGTYDEAVSEGDRKDVKQLVSCKCASTHMGRPEGEKGCGFYAVISVP